MKFKDLTPLQKGQTLHNLNIEGLTLDELNELEVIELFAFCNSKEGSENWYNIIKGC